MLARVRSPLLLLILLAACAKAPPPAPAVEPPLATEAGASVASPAPAVPSAPPAPADASTPETAAAPPVKVENIGMHIGGGPNDAETKAPIGTSVSPHFGELRACWSQVSDPAKGGDFGIDLLIPAEGGLAAVSHPRTAIHPDAFRDCVVDVFSKIVFARPRTGRTTVSYSLRLTPTRS